MHIRGREWKKWSWTVGRRQQQQPLLAFELVCGTRMTFAFKQSVKFTKQSFSVRFFTLRKLIPCIEGILTDSTTFNSGTCELS